MQPTVATPTVRTPPALAWPHLMLLLGGLCLACMVDIICSTGISTWGSVSSLKGSMHGMVHSSEGGHDSNSNVLQKIRASTAERFTRVDTAYGEAAHRSRRQLMWKKYESSDVNLLRGVLLFTSIPHACLNLDRLLHKSQSTNLLCLLHCGQSVQFSDCLFTSQEVCHTLTCCS